VFSPGIPGESLLSALHHLYIQYNTVWLLSTQLRSTFPSYITRTELQPAGDMQRESLSKEAASPADAPVPLRAGRTGYWTSNLDLTWQTYLPVLLVLSFAAGCGSARARSSG
jgi:hypothetical protein